MYLQAKRRKQKKGAIWYYHTRQWYMPIDGNPADFEKWMPTNVYYIPLDCQCNSDHKEVKKLGAAYNPYERTWYIRKGHDTTPFSKWLKK